MKRWQWWAAAVCAYVFILSALAPATLVDAIAAHYSGGRVRIADARGTLWSGRGELQLVDPRQATAVSKPVSWKISPASLFAGRLVCTIATDETPRGFTATMTPSRLEIANAQLNMPATALGVMEPRLAPLALGGTFEMRIAEFVFGRTELRANAVIVWRGARTDLSPVTPLGDYEFTVAPAANGLALQLRTIDGALQLEGTGSWTPGANPTLHAMARALPQQRDALEPFLRLIAYDRGSGNYEIRVQ